MRYLVGIIVLPPVAHWKTRAYTEQGTNRSCWISHSPTRFPCQLGSWFLVAESHTSCSLSNLNVVQTHSSSLSWCLGKVPGQRIPRAFVTSQAEPPESGSFLLSHRLLLCLGVPGHPPGAAQPRALDEAQGQVTAPCRGRRPLLHPGHNLQPPPELPALNGLLSRQGGRTPSLKDFSTSICIADSSPNRKVWNLSSVFIFPHN